MRAAATMSVRAAATRFVVLLLTVPVAVVLSQSEWSVTYDTHKFQVHHTVDGEICASRGSTVNIRCTYNYPSDHKGTVSDLFWFIKESEEAYADLKTDPQYSGRVEYTCADNRCTLSISDVRQSDSAEYKFRFKTTEPGGTWSGSPGVTLSVKDLEVKVLKLFDEPGETRLRCQGQGNCNLDTGLTFYWYKNDTFFKEDALSVPNFYPGDRVSCAIKDYQTSRSPTALVQARYGWDVSYASTEICAFSGSTVNITCYYRYPEYVNGVALKQQTGFWFKNDMKNVDLSKDPQYSGRVKSVCKNFECCLTIRNLTTNDSAEYNFGFTTERHRGTVIGSPGVTVSVKDPQLQVHIRRSMHIGIWTELTCHSRCTHPRHPFFWIDKDNKVKGEKEYILLKHIASAAGYYCAIKEGKNVRFRSPSVSAPEVFVVSTTPSGDIVEGSSVTLTCSSDAHPAANYTWNKKNESEEVQLLREGTQFAFSSIQLSESGVYHCTAENELGRNSKDIFIDVKYAPRSPSVSVSPTGEIVEGSSVNLTCSSDANPAANCTWYKNHTRIGEPKNIYHFTGISSWDRGVYHCKCENKHGHNSTSKSIDVLLSPSGAIVEGSSVTLTCSSDANPPADYTWNKKNERKEFHLHLEGTGFDFSSIQSSDSGVYHCTAENELGRNSTDIIIAVKYAPRSPSVSVSPSGEIVEGSSVSLTCSSDANPTANCTWYRNHTRIGEPKNIYHFTAISSGDRGVYQCKCENQYGYNSIMNSLDVLYAPKIPSVSVSPSGEIVEGSSVTLTCSSDANPPADYTWYKENEDSRKASAQIFTIADVRVENGGNYSCFAQNTQGCHNSTVRLMVIAASPGAWKSTVIGIISAVFLGIMLLFAFFLIRELRASKQSSQPGYGPGSEQGDFHSATFHFLKNQTDAVFYNIGPGGASRYEDEDDDDDDDDDDEEDEDEFAYAAVTFKSFAPSRGQDTGEDPAKLYSTVKKNF
ncbi:B-cell receptor CD22-like isoform X3 [Scophthalmus maximus]|uniref:B-cell receptor CD22-like isoform X3 n=1 Tax=Scophthalmus maximus TaxID=52904 RepID=UPI001FA9036F|nr:B-cell receptor CD22-like isoform X3 [Scophthalmus maximus]